MNTAVAATRRPRSSPALRSLGVAAALCMSGLAPCAVAARAPAWVQEAQTAAFPGESKHATAVVLHDELVIEYRADGRVSETTRGAVRILTRDGRDAAHTDTYFNAKDTRIDSAKAWLIRPSGEVRTFQRRDFLERAEFDGALYSEGHVLTLWVTDEAESGSVFAWEVSTTEPTSSTQHYWSFQQPYPVVWSRLAVRVPAEWQVEGKVFNHASIPPKVNGTESSWELTHLAAVEMEPLAPSPRALAAAVAVSVFPKAPSKNAARSQRSFATWEDVAAYASEVADPQALPDPTVAAKAAELTRGATTLVEKIAAIARYTQELRYVIVATRLNFGGGYTPHSAADVLRCGYGDCKDKATLMRALLQAAGIASHLVLVQSDNAPVIWDEWPSPGQFNHAIVAVRVPDSVAMPAIVDVGETGRLLIFDPTDPITSLGDLPAHYQGSKGLLALPERGRLVTLPLIASDASELNRTVSMILSPDGSVSGRLREDAIGQEAVSGRDMVRRMRPSAQASLVGDWIVSGLREATVTRVAPSEDATSGAFALEAAFEAPRFGRLMQSTLMVFKPFALSQRSRIKLTAAERKCPVVLRASCFQESVTIDLPPGFEVSELPQPARIQTEYGSFETTVDADGSRLKLTRRLQVQPMIAPVADYSRVRQFFDAVSRVEQASVVLQWREPSP